MTGGPFDSPGKQAVRELWNTPLLEYLNRTYGLRYRYMGLPGVDLIDISLWKDMIDEVIAFEVRAKPSGEDPQGRRLISELRRKLRLLGIPGHAYFGPIEEVVIQQEDYDGTAYLQDRVVTLYNLDFCDEIASQIPTRQRGRRVWRFEAIRQLLRDQRECFRRSGGPSLFVILLTVRNQIDAAKLHEFLAANPFSDTEKYLDACGGHASLPVTGNILGTHTWALKAFLHNQLRHYLSNPHISALFFPTVKYTGTPVRTRRRLLPSPMIHLMLLCRFDQAETPSPSFVPVDYLAGALSVRAHDAQAVTWDPEPGEEGTPDADPTSEDWLRRIEGEFLEGLTT